MTLPGSTLKKIFLKIFFYYFKIWNAKHKLNAVNANITKAEKGRGAKQANKTTFILTAKKGKWIGSSTKKLAFTCINGWSPFTIPRLSTFFSYLYFTVIPLLSRVFERTQLLYRYEFSSLNEVMISQTSDIEMLGTCRVGSAP